MGKKNGKVLFWFLGGRKQLGVGAGRRREERRPQAQAVQTTCEGGNMLFGSLLKKKKKKDLGAAARLAHQGQAVGIIREARLGNRPLHF